MSLLQLSKDFGPLKGQIIVISGRWICLLFSFGWKSSLPVDITSQVEQVVLEKHSSVWLKVKGHQFSLETWTASEAKRWQRRLAPHSFAPM